jgi:hypothetical protein
MAKLRSKRKANRISENYDDTRTVETYDDYFTGVSFDPDFDDGSSNVETYKKGGIDLPMKFH